jgi:beta-mannosidase
MNISLTNGWTFYEARSKRWFAARVPGCIHTDLLRHNLIPDPFWGRNERNLQWIENEDWKYRCEFVVPAGALSDPTIELVADGVDTVAEIRLNGRKVGQTESMFTGYRFDIRKHLKKGKNLIDIKFTSPLKYCRAHRPVGHPAEWCDPVGGSSVIRKAQYSFGWDWGPRFVTSGLYLPMRIETRSAARFHSVGIRQIHRKVGVELHFTPRVEGEFSGKIRGSVSLRGRSVASFANRRTLITEPELWWPNGHGSQPLYEVNLELVEADGRVVDQWRKRIGLRTIELDRHRDAFGESFQFVVNGRPIFAKGANWIPAHSFLTEVNRVTYDDLMTSATEAHMNMIRVWGGGTYEKEDFYDLCDEKGILVWQDFLFACALYPGTAHFLRLVREEAEHQVTRIAHHACLALWCGNNEIEQIPEYIIETPERKKAYDELFYHLLPDVVGRFGGTTAYWPSSPHNPEGYEKGFNNESAGDAHFWDVWHARKPVKTYEEKNFRFNSEFGMQSYNSPEVAATYCRPEDFNVFGPEMENHQKNAAGNLIILDYLSRRYRFPKDYASLAYLSQLNQAYAMKVGVEHFRRSMPRTMGALYWQLNDCWPVASWSSIEFGGNWKALHYEAKRFFAPALVSAHILGDETAGKGNYLKSSICGIEIFTVFDGPDDAAAELSWRLEHLEGGTIRENRKNVRLRYGKSVKQVNLNFSKEIKAFGASSLYVRILLEASHGEISRQTVFLTAPRYIQFQPSIIERKIKKLAPGKFGLSLRSATFQHAVSFHCRGISFRADDNFFDLFPNEERSVEIRTKHKVAMSELKNSLEVRSLVDSYS